jgi:hypothetical protein
VTSKRLTTAAVALATASALSRPASAATVDEPPTSFSLGGFAQFQYERADDARDAVGVDGRPLNTTGLSLRRARLRASATRDIFETRLELDAGTGRRTPVTPRRAEGVVTVAPWLRLTAGLTRIPFGAELPAETEGRPFMERTSGSRALFPGEVDLAVRLSGEFGRLQWDVGATNGAPLADGQNPVGADPVAAPDWVGRVGFEAGGEHLSGRLGASFLTGTGLHPGTPATKAGVTWKDNDEDSVIDAGELTPLAPRAATPSETFSRWAVNVDAALTGRTGLGETRLEGEATLASNLARGDDVADPVLSGYDRRALALTVAVLHHCAAGGFAGFRWETYEPDADLTESRRGDRVPVDARRTVYAPLVGWRFASTWRVSAQYEHIVEARGRDSLGVPADLEDDRLTVRLQVAP